MAWGASNQTELERYITPDATVATRTGLAKAVSYTSVSEVVIPVGNDTRKGTLVVQWATPAAGSYTQTYNITVVKNADGRWFVKDIAGGAFSSSSEAAVEAPTEEDPAITGPDGTGDIQ